MPKKSKIGKQRKDKYYHLAKETGYRSRAAFKLIQLNRKFEFLQRSKVCVDLCAAPGGWMQVAVNHMPVASIIVGVDLFPIKPIPGCISFCEDITTPQCLTKLKQELKTWKADIVLHDGAPNVGQNWLHDAYGQNCLTLSAFKLATSLLRPGGFFVTKVFRSKDYNALQWVLQQFFRNVYSTKPAASRTESAEIFVVCKGYLAPAQIDPKFLDPKHVFEDIDMPDNKKQLKQLLTELGKKKKAEGYPTDEALLYRPIKASEFLKSADYVELLANTSKIIIDEEWIVKSEKTTQDIREYCEDVKVLGRKDIKALVAWRKDLRAKLEQYAKLKSEGGDVVAELGDGDQEVVAEEEEEEDEETKLDRAIEEIKDSQKREDRRKKRKVLKERRKLHEKTNLKMVIPGDIGPTDISEDTLFSLKSVKSNAEVDLLTEEPQLPIVPEEPDLTFEEEVDQFVKRQKAKKVSFNKSEEVLDNSGRFYRKIDTEQEEENEADDSDSSEDPDLDAGLDLKNDSGHQEDSGEELEFEEEPMEEEYPLITDLDYSSKDLKRIRKAEMWFDKPIFSGLADESDEEIEINKLAESYISRGADVLGFESKNAAKTKEPADESAAVKKKDKKKKKRTDNDEDKLDLEFEAPPSKKSKKAKKLDAEGLALGTLLVQSKKTKRDILDDGWNRYAFNDDGLPDWFVSDEKKHMKKSIPIPTELVNDYKKNLTEINARPIKKVMEAKARKKKRAIRKMEKAKKKAEAILDKSDMTETEKANQIKQVYKKAQQTKRKEVTYVVAKKHTSGKRMKRPAGVKGPYKVVDARMKKDLRAMKQQGKGGGKGGKGRGKSAPRGKGRGGRR